METWKKDAIEALTGMGYPLSAGIVAGGRALASVMMPKSGIETHDTDLFIYGLPTVAAREWLAACGARKIEKLSQYAEGLCYSENYHVGDDLDLIFLEVVRDPDTLFARFDLGVCCVGWLPETDVYFVHSRAQRDYTLRQISVIEPHTENRAARAAKYAARLGWPIAWTAVEGFPELSRM